MLQFQDDDGNQLQEYEVDDEDALNFCMNAAIQTMGDVLNIEGKFKVDYGTDHIIMSIAALKALANLKLQT